MFLLSQYEKKIQEFKGAHAPAETSGTKTFTIKDNEGNILAKYLDREVRSTVWEMLCIYVARANDPDACANLFKMPDLNYSIFRDSTVLTLPVAMDRRNGLNYALRHLNLKFWRGEDIETNKDGSYVYSDEINEETKNALDSNPPWVILEEKKNICVVSQIVNFGIDPLCGIWAIVLSKPINVVKLEHLTKYPSEGVAVEEKVVGDAVLLSCHLPYLSTEVVGDTVYSKVPTVQQLSDKLEEAAGLRIIKGELQPFRSDNQDHRALYNTLYEKTDTLEKYYVTKIETWASQGIPMLNIVLRKVTRDFTR